MSGREADPPRSRMHCRAHKFFFFKQKTAYEVCGRDWSSDVCSSDLTQVMARRFASTCERSKPVLVSAALKDTSPDMVTDRTSVV